MHFPHMIIIVKNYPKIIISLYSTGFAVENEDDKKIPETNGQQRNMICGTEKDKHKSKNHRTAGKVSYAYSKI